MDYLLQKKVNFFKKISSKLNLHDAYKICILQIYVGLKNAASFDAIPKANHLVIRQIILLLNCLNVHSNVLELDKNIKIIFSNNKKIVFGLSQLHKEVFDRRIPYNEKEYAQLLGYPSCCVSQHVRIQEKQYENLFGFPICPVEFKPLQWKWSIYFKLNRFSEFNVISHIPCTLNCQKTLQLADQILDLYRLYSLDLTKKVITSLKHPILIFKSNNYIRFKDRLKNDNMNYSSIDYLIPLSIECGFETSEDKQIKRIINLIEAGDKIEFKRDRFVVFKKNKFIVDIFQKDRPYQFYNFQ